MRVLGQDWPKIGMVIPVFGHSRLVAEAIASAFEQTYAGVIEIVVVIDGDRDAETLETVRAFLGRPGRRLSAVFRKNGRLPAARNTGIRYLIDNHSDLFAVFFLDADNRLTPQSMTAFVNALTDNPRARWAYPDVTFFGINWGYSGIDIRETAPDYSRFRHLMGNICEAGSMVRADVFRGDGRRPGVMFDETFTHGYEDWEFWLQCLQRGWHGTRVANAGFLYRRRADSMLADADRMSGDIRGTIRRKHAALFAAETMWTAYEAEFAPVLFVDGSGRLSLMSTADHIRHISPEAFVLLLDNGLSRYHHSYFPRIIATAMHKTNRPPPIDRALLQTLLASSWPTGRVYLTKRGQLCADTSADPIYALHPFEVVGEDTAPADFDPAAFARLRGVFDALRTRPKRAHVSRRYSGPASYRIDQVLRASLNESTEPTAATSAPARRCLLLHRDEPAAANAVAEALADHYRTTIADITMFGGPSASPEHETHYAGTRLVYREDDARFRLVGATLPAFDAIFLVDDTRYLFHAGQWKGDAALLAPVFTRTLSNEERNALLAVEHSLPVIICRHEDCTRLAALGIPSRKLETLADFAAGLNRAGAEPDKGLSPASSGPALRTPPSGRRAVFGKVRSLLWRSNPTR